MSTMTLYWLLSEFRKREAGCRIDGRPTAAAVEYDRWADVIVTHLRREVKVPDGCVAIVTECGYEPDKSLNWLVPYGVDSLPTGSRLYVFPPRARAAIDACERFFTVENDGSWKLRQGVELEQIVTAIIIAAAPTTTATDGQGGEG